MFHLVEKELCEGYNFTTDDTEEEGTQSSYSNFSFICQYAFMLPMY